MRTTPIKRVNRARKKKRRERDFGPKADFIRRQNCCACGRLGSDPHHYPSRGAGGTSKDLVPLCYACHTAFHSEGQETFQARHDIDLGAEAEKYERWFQGDPEGVGF